VAKAAGERAGDAAEAASQAEIVASCYTNQAKCFTALQQDERALATCDTAIKADKTHFGGWASRGTALFNSGGTLRWWRATRRRSPATRPPSSLSASRRTWRVRWTWRSSLI